MIFQQLLDLRPQNLIVIEVLKPQIDSNRHGAVFRIELNLFDGNLTQGKLKILEMMPAFERRLGLLTLKIKFFGRFRWFNVIRREIYDSKSQLKITKNLRKTSFLLIFLLLDRTLIISINRNSFAPSARPLISGIVEAVSGRPVAGPP